MLAGPRARKDSELVQQPDDRVQNEHEVPILQPAEHKKLDKQTTVPTTVTVSNANQVLESTAAASFSKSKPKPLPNCRNKDENNFSGLSRIREPRPRPQYQHRHCPGALMVDAAKCGKPGSWNWDAVGQLLCHTFTKQDGGSHNNPRVQKAADIMPADASGRGHCIHRPCTVQHMITEDDGACKTGEIHATKNNSKIPSPVSKRLATIMNVSEHDLRNHQLAKEAASAAQAVGLRQKQWDLQSALLPLMKQGVARQPLTVAGRL